LLLTIKLVAASGKKATYTLYAIT